MKKLVTTLLGAAFLMIGMNIADLKNVPLPTTVQTVAASTVSQPIDHLFDQVKRANPDTVRDTVKVEVPVPCKHKQLPAKTIVKRTTIKKTDTSYVPLLYIVESGEKVDSTNHDFTIRKGELRDYIQIASNVRK
nr:MAG TPA: hypothetical protein [Bacteriophage sp.]